MQRIHHLCVAMYSVAWQPKFQSSFLLPQENEGGHEVARVGMSARECIIVV